MSFNTGFKRGYTAADDVNADNQQQIKSTRPTDAYEYTRDHLADLKEEDIKKSGNISGIIHKKIVVNGPDATILPNSVLDVILAHVSPDDFDKVAAAWPNVPADKLPTRAKSDAFTTKSPYFPIEPHFVTPFLNAIMYNVACTKDIADALTTHYGRDALVRTYETQGSGDRPFRTNELIFNHEDDASRPSVVDALRTNFVRAIISLADYKFTSVVRGDSKTKEFLISVGGENYSQQDNFALQLRENGFFDYVYTEKTSMFTIKSSHTAKFESRPFDEAPKLNITGRLDHLIHSIIDSENNDKGCAVYLDFIVSRFGLSQALVEMKKDVPTPIKKVINAFTHIVPTGSQLTSATLSSYTKLKSEDALCDNLSKIREKYIEAFGRYKKGEVGSDAADASDVDRILFNLNAAVAAKLDAKLDPRRTDRASSDGLYDKFVAAAADSADGRNIDIFNYMNFANTKYLHNGTVSMHYGIMQDTIHTVNADANLSFSNCLRAALYAFYLYNEDYWSIKKKRVNRFFFTAFHKSGAKTETFEDAYEEFKGFYLTEGSAGFRLKFNMNCKSYAEAVHNNSYKSPNTPRMNMVMTNIGKIVTTKDENGDYITLPKEYIAQITKDRPFFLTPIHFTKGEVNFSGDNFAEMLRDPVYTMFCNDGSQYAKTTIDVDILLTRPSKLSLGKFNQNQYGFSSNIAELLVHKYEAPQR